MIDIQPLILMADDDDDDLMFAKEAFEASGIPGNFLTFRNGEELLKYLSNSQIPRLILLDINMPLVDGYMVMEEIASVQAFQSIPVVILSTTSQEHSDVDRFSSAASYYVKPSSYGGWLKMMKEIISKWIVEDWKR